MRPPRFVSAAAFRSVALAVAIAACAGDGTGPTAPTMGARLRLSSSVSGTPISTIVVTVTATDIRDALVFNIGAVNGVAAGTLDVPPGHARVITAQGFDATGVITHEGSTQMDVSRGTNPPVVLTMRPRSGQVSVSVTVGSVGLTVSRASLGLVQGLTGTLAARPVDETGAEIAGAVVTWASTNPAIARVSASGVVTALLPGTAQIVATYAGVASTCAVQVARNDVILVEAAFDPPMNWSTLAVIADGSSERIVTGPWQQMAGWSPDHQRIVYVHWTYPDMPPPYSEVWVMNADGTDRRQLTSTGLFLYPRFSPDGGRIAYLRDNKLTVMNADGSGDRELTSYPNLSAQPPSWSPDGTRVVIGVSGALVIVDVASGAWRSIALPAGSEAPAWSVDGTEIMFSDGYGLQAVTVDGSRRRTIMAAGPDTYPRHGVWSPDGSRIAYTVLTPGSSTLWVANPDGTERRQISTVTSAQFPAWR